MKTEPDNRMYQQLPMSSGLEDRKKETVSTNTAGGRGDVQDIMIPNYEYSKELLKTEKIQASKISLLYNLEATSLLCEV